MGGKLHLKLNNDARPIANKYREGKVKRTLKRELKVTEIAKMEADETSILLYGLFQEVVTFCVASVKSHKRNSSFLECFH